ncbi:hypothetical protein ACS0TY_014404 [Phlomoides rotata]
MVAEPWILRMGNQVSSNLKNALYLENSTKSSNKKQGFQERCTIGILAFEVANVMSKIIHLHKSLADNEILRLKNEILKSEGIRVLVSSDENQLLQLALEEKLDDLNKVASVVSRLGKKCTIPVLRGFEHVYGDIVSGIVDIKELSFLVKDMDSMIRKIERYVNSTARLYSEIEVMNELELATKKFQHEESRKAFEQKLTWQKQDVRHLKDVSLWNQTYDKIVELLVRTVCTVYARICVVFEDAYSRRGVNSGSFSRSVVSINGKSLQRAKLDSGMKTGQINAGDSFHPEDYNPNPVCCMGRGRLFTECLNLSSSAAKEEGDDNDDDRFSYDGESSQISSCFSASSDVKTLKGEHPDLSGPVFHAITTDLTNAKFGDKNRLMGYAGPTTLGGCALALHYANIIIVLEKLLRYPHLVGDEARDDLYKMLPTSLRKTVKSSLKSYVKDMGIYDAPLAHSWRERVGSMLGWVAPLAHNMMRWQGERSFEQHQIVSRKNVVLLQTLLFADREKTEAVICEVLVGLNYICRYEQQQNALLDCSSSFDFEDCMEWQLQGV